MTPAFRAQCATCMRVNHDPAARKCPACGSCRLVVLQGRRHSPEIERLLRRVFARMEGIEYLALHREATP